MKAVVRPLIYFLIFAVVAVTGGAFVINVIQRPLNKPVNTYSADFTDATGLRAGNDVRLLGVPVGKVEKVELKQGDDAVSHAQVTFTIDRHQHLFPDTMLGIRYLNLTGIRYLDVQQKSTSGSSLKPGTHVAIGSTTPSFDITRVFRGLQPVLTTLNPDDLNHLFASILALVQGDSSGLSGTISSLTKVLKFVDNRKQIIDTLINNMTSLATTINGKSQYLGPILGYLDDVATALSNNIEPFRELADTSGTVLQAADYLLASLGIKPNDTPDANAIARQIMPAARSLLSVLSTTPALLNTINDALPPDPTKARVNTTCSHGLVALPANMAVFLQGAKVTLCQR